MFEKSSLKKTKKVKRSIRIFCFSDFARKKLFILGLEISISQNIRNFFRLAFFHFLNSESFFLKYKKNMRLESSISWNIRNSFEVDLFYFFDIWLKSSTCENIRVLFSEIKEKLFLRKYKKFFQSGFFSFFNLELKSGPDSCIIHYLGERTVITRSSFFRFLSYICFSVNSHVKTFWNLFTLPTQINAYSITIPEQ